jgi:sigma-E factor negative regulatory protein RseC
MREKIEEQGIVVGVADGMATISVTRSGVCEECGARLFCKTSTTEPPRVTAKDPLGVQAGDNVRISIPGQDVLLASVCLYGIPLLLFIAGVSLGVKFFFSHIELYSSLLGIGLCLLYYLALWLISRTGWRQRRMMPQIDKIL